MSRKIIEQLVDDIDGREGVDTIHFSFGGQHFEIDLSIENSRKFREALRPYMENGRRVSPATEPRPPRKRRQTRAPRMPAAPPVLPATTETRTPATPDQVLPDSAVAPSAAPGPEGRQASPTPAPPSILPRVTIVPADPKVVRKWAKAKGYKIAAKGRIPDEIRQAFEDAQRT